MSRRKLIYEGKAKILYEGPERNTMVQYFKDDATAFNNEKKAIIEGKGVLNNRISEFIYNQLNDVGLETHLIKRLNMREQLIKSCEVLPIEFVVRNIAAGSIVNRLGLNEGSILKNPIVEYYYKNDALGDPIVTIDHIKINDWANEDEIKKATNISLRINDILSGLFRAVGIKLVDFKLEFGRYWNNEEKKIILVDEISPDTCRLWDTKNEKKLDKDRFRKDLGGLIEAYQEVAKRLGIMPEGTNIKEIKTGISKTIKLKKS